MPSQLEIAVILGTYQRPQHLERSLASLALQRGAEGKFEVVVTDDGSDDQTPNLVETFARTVDFPVTFTTHPHDGYRLALCRNDGVRKSTAPYLLFSDGDCLFPPDHLRKHLRARRTGVARAGNCVRLDERETNEIDLAAIATHAYRRIVSRRERRRMTSRWLKDSLYQLRPFGVRPKLTGCNIGVWRSDLVAVNGFDESFVGWGCEDDDLAFRLRSFGVRIRTALGYTYAYHMWHFFDPSQPAHWSQGQNVGRLRRDDRSVQCTHGLVTLPLPERNAA